MYSDHNEPPTEELSGYEDNTAEHLGYAVSEIGRAVSQDEIGVDFADQFDGPLERLEIRRMSDTPAESRVDQQGWYRNGRRGDDSEEDDMFGRSFEDDGGMEEMEFSTHSGETGGGTRQTMGLTAEDISEDSFLNRANGGGVGDYSHTRSLHSDTLDRHSTMRSHPDGRQPNGPNVIRDGPSDSEHDENDERDERLTTFSSPEHTREVGGIEEIGAQLAQVMGRLNQSFPQQQQQQQREEEEEVYWDEREREIPDTPDINTTFTTAQLSVTSATNSEEDALNTANMGRDDMIIQLGAAHQLRNPLPTPDNSSEGQIISTIAEVYSVAREIRNEQVDEMTEAVAALRVENIRVVEELRVEADDDATLRLEPPPFQNIDAHRSLDDGFVAPRGEYSLNGSFDSLDHPNMGSQETLGAQSPESMRQDSEYFSQGRAGGGGGSHQRGHLSSPTQFSPFSNSGRGRFGNMVSSLGYSSRPSTPGGGGSARDSGFGPVEDADEMFGNYATSSNPDYEDIARQHEMDFSDLMGESDHDNDGFGSDRPPESLFASSSSIIGNGRNQWMRPGHRVSQQQQNQSTLARRRNFSTWDGREATVEAMREQEERFAMDMRNPIELMGKANSLGMSDADSEVSGLIPADLGHSTGGSHRSAKSPMGRGWIRFAAPGPGDRNIAASLGTPQSAPVTDHPQQQRHAQNNRYGHYGHYGQRENNGQADGAVLLPPPPTTPRTVMSRDPYHGPSTRVLHAVPPFNAHALPTPPSGIPQGEMQRAQPQGQMALLRNARPAGPRSIDDMRRPPPLTIAPRQSTPDHHHYQQQQQSRQQQQNYQHPQDRQPSHQQDYQQQQQQHNARAAAEFAQVAQVNPDYDQSDDGSLGLGSLLLGDMQPTESIRINRTPLATGQFAPAHARILGASRGMASPMRSANAAGGAGFVSRDWTSQSTVTSAAYVPFQEPTVDIARLPRYKDVALGKIDSVSSMENSPRAPVVADGPGLEWGGRSQGELRGMLSYESDAVHTVRYESPTPSVGSMEALDMGHMGMSGFGRRQQLPQQQQGQQQSQVASENAEGTPSLKEIYDMVKVVLTTMSSQAQIEMPPGAGAKESGRPADTGRSQLGPIAVDHDSRRMRTMSTLDRQLNNVYAGISMEAEEKQRERKREQQQQQPADISNRSYPDSRPAAPTPRRRNNFSRFIDDESGSFAGSETAPAPPALVAASDAETNATDRFMQRYRSEVAPQRTQSTQQYVERYTSDTAAGNYSVMRGMSPLMPSASSLPQPLSASVTREISDSSGADGGDGGGGSAQGLARVLDALGEGSISKEDLYRTLEEVVSAVVSKNGSFERASAQQASETPDQPQPQQQQQQPRRGMATETAVQTEDVPADNADAGDDGPVDKAFMRSVLASMESHFERIGKQLLVAKAQNQSEAAQLAQPTDVGSVPEESEPRESSSPALPADQQIVEAPVFETPTRRGRLAQGVHWPSGQEEPEPRERLASPPAPRAVSPLRDRFSMGGRRGYRQQMSPLAGRGRPQQQQQQAMSAFGSHFANADHAADVDAAMDAMADEYDNEDDGELSDTMTTVQDDAPMPVPGSVGPALVHSASTPSHRSQLLPLSMTPQKRSKRISRESITSHLGNGDQLGRRQTLDSLRRQHQHEHEHEHEHEHKQQQQKQQSPRSNVRADDGYDSLNDAIYSAHIVRQLSETLAGLEQEHIKRFHHLRSTKAADCPVCRSLEAQNHDPYLYGKHAVAYKSLPMRRLQGLLNAYVDVMTMERPHSQRSTLSPPPAYVSREDDLQAVRGDSLYHSFTPTRSGKVIARSLAQCGSPLGDTRRTTGVVIEQLREELDAVGRRYRRMVGEYEMLDPTRKSDQRRRRQMAGDLKDLVDLLDVKGEQIATLAGLHHSDTLPTSRVAAVPAAAVGERKGVKQRKQLQQQRRAFWDDGVDMGSERVNENAGGSVNVSGGGSGGHAHMSNTEWVYNSARDLQKALGDMY
ncbi:hypothetical protein LPJ66_002580 [Kickxella alabastrina]|uniref:Uncharacterized protein n=1 Tax=Kickxella alabastrina TaxID=61397 RepID=A0ACC1IQ11_9FUNG|nr:hypothetical protein LPJ66_002580 [Kickxella alabastrina]